MNSTRKSLFRMNTKQLLTLSTVSLAGASAALATADYGPAVDRMITGCAKWYTSGYGHKFAVVHCMEGYYLTGTSYLRRCDISVSCHYTVNGLVDYAGDAPRGEISQLVPEAYYAWHATCWNQHSLGTEHEGFVSNPAWFTEEMYQASAQLHRHFADKFGFAKDRNHIVGHGEKSNGAWCAYASANLGINPYCNTHTDPGPYWNWSHYMALVQGVQNPPYFFDSGPQGWTSGNSMSGLAWTATGWPGIIYADQTGNDAWYYSPDTSYTGGGDSSFNVGVYPQSGTTANHDMQMFFRTSAENSFTADKSSPMVSYTAQNQWVRINLDVNAAWPKYFNKTITGLRLDVDNVNSSTRWIINHVVAQTSLRWRFDGNAQGWTSLNALSPVNWTDCCGWPGIIYADQTGNDPHFVSPANLNMLGGINDVLRVRVFPQGGSTANHDMQIFFATASQNQFSESKSVTLYYTAKDGWADLYFPVGQNGYWNSDYITRLRVDPDQTNHGNRWIIDLVLVEHLTTPATIPGPTIGEQPQMQTTSVGGSATLSVFPNGTAPFTYQWRRNGVNVPGATARDYTIANAQLSQAGFYDVVVSNAGGSVTSTPAQLVVSTTPFATGTGTGLQGQYFDNLDFTNPKLSRTDATINFNWGTGSPDPAIANTTYSVRWTGQVQPRYSQAYTFYTKTDDGARLWVNGELLIDKWVDQAATEWSGTLELVAGQSYAIQMDYYQQGSLASAVLSWSSASEPKAVIPQTQLYVTSPPAIVSQPQSQTITAGYEATFSVGAGGAPPLFYQWRKDGVDLAGATASTLTLADVQSAQEGIYSVVITNNFGSTLSSNATLTVLNTPPTITTQPQGRTVLAGFNVTFTVAATGALPLRYQWLFNGSPLAGATQSALTRSSVTPADAGIYAVVVTNQFGAQASAEAELVVRALPEIITQPVGQTLARGASVTFSVAATGGAPLAYQWRRNGVNIGGATTSSYTKGNIQSGDVGMYSVVVSNPYGTVTSAEAPLTLTGAIAFQDNFSGCTLGQWTTAASPATELVASSEQNHTGGGGCSAKQDNTSDYMYHNFGNYSGHTRVSFYWYDDGASTKSYLEMRSYANGSYPGSLTQVLAVGKYNTVTAPGEVYDLRKYQLRVVYPSASMGWMNCETNSSGGARSAGWHKFSIERLADGTTLKFTVDDVATRTITGANAANWNTVFIGTGSGSTGITAYFDDVVVEYFDPPSIVVPPAGQTVALGGSATFSVVATNNPQSYQWRRNGENIAGATEATLTVNNAQEADAGAYTVQVSNGVGPVVSAAAVLTVLGMPPEITLQPASQTNQAGSTVSFTVAATGQAPLAYRWQKDGVDLSDGGIISGAQTDTLTLAGVTAAEEGSYAVGVTNAAGGVRSEAAVLVVQNPPVITLNPAGQAVAAGATVTFSVEATGTALSYQWKLNGDPIAGATASACTRNNVQTADAGAYTVTVANAVGSVTSDPAVLTVNNPPILAAIPDRTIHVGSTVVISSSVTHPDLDQTLTFSLEPGAPAEATLDTATGVFRWTAPETSLNTTNPVTIRVSDDGTPSLGDARSFSITVMARPAILSAVLAGDFINLTWSSIPGLTYRVQYKLNLADAEWTDLMDVTAADWTTVATDSVIAYEDPIPQRFYRIEVQD
jgi:hypothetical protein